jgi:uracil-DNA glycosylase
MNSIEEIYKKINKCELCNLHKNRIKDFSYRGNKDAPIFLIGEAPGKEEQKNGVPFCGRSGKLLDKLLIKAGLDIEKDIYISNIVHCRPPNNRKPFYDEVVSCFPFVLSEMEVVSPKLIITLGKTSGDWFNNYHEYEINKYYKEKKWLPLYHPSYLLRKNDQVELWLKSLESCLNENNIK